MKLLTLSLLVFIFNGGLQQDSPSTATPTDATGGPSTGTPAPNMHGVNRSFPIIIPYNNSQDITNIPPHWGTCLLYMEGITIVAINHATSKSGGQKAVFAHITGTQDKNKWIFSDESLNCSIKSGPTKDTILNGSFVEFRVALILDGVGAIDGKNGPVGYNVSKLEFTLHFDVPSLDNWYLEYVMLRDIQIGKGSYLTEDLSISNFDANATKVDAKLANIRGFYGYSYGCSATPAIFFDSNTSVSIGLQFNNFQIEPYNIYINNGSLSTGKIGVQFKSNVNDCVPTFTTGSLMSIISILVLFVVFIFGFLMLNSVQTMDRFDDPKGKQIVITTKE